MIAIDLRAADSVEDHARLTALARVIWHQHYPGIISRAQIDYMLDSGYRAAALAAQQAVGTRFTLAWWNRRPVALAACSPDTPDTQTAWLDKLYVHEDARGQGLANALVARAKNQAATMGARTLRLRVNRNNIAAVAAYERLGFVIEYSHVKHIGHGYVMDDFVMASPLGRGLCAAHRHGA